jgi:hypothetical protein
LVVGYQKGVADTLKVDEVAAEVYILIQITT